MFREELEAVLEHPEDKERGKQNLKVMEGLVDKLTTSGDYVDTQNREKKSAPAAQKKIKKEKSK